MYYSRSGRSLKALVDLVGGNRDRGGVDGLSRSYCPSMELIPAYGLWLTRPIVFSVGNITPEQTPHLALGIPALP
jgi:hypothetical protein